jgi:Carboxypeptidase regulatory-like domain
VLRNGGGAGIAGASLRLASDSAKLTATTAEAGTFRFERVPAGRYSLTVEVSGRDARLPAVLDLPSALPSAVLVLSAQNELSIETASQEATGGEQLSSKAVSSLPLNKRDFSTLLLLAAGTMTDANGATNFTQQFAINGQRGVEAVFAQDGADISDPEMGGATFSNFNVDAVEEIQSSSGWMPAEIGRGAAGFTNIRTRSGAGGFHGSVFEFLRNSALDARNFFDHPSIAEPGRIPPFRRNEFGFTNGGPVVLPHLYKGADRTFYFVQYQGFRQVLGTTQVIPVPTSDERQGIDATAFAGDTLTVPVDPAIAAILSRYPMPNSTSGFGAHSYATSSKVVTNANQFSIRFDHKLSTKDQLLFRFNFDNLTGPTTNPDQTVLDPSFAVEYKDHQRNGMLSYTRTVSPRLTLVSSISATRTTPQFPTPNHTDPAVHFGDGLFEPFNAAAGSVMESFGNLFQGQQSFALIAGRHTLKAGGEFRTNRDTTYFGTAVNGEYTFGGGTAYSPVEIKSASGTHDIHVGDPLPDTLSGLLTASPFSYDLAIAPPYFSNGTHIGPAAITRNAGAFYFQDTWKINGRLTLDYGLRYELYSPITERAHRTSGFKYPQGIKAGVKQFVINPQPGYQFNLGGFGPRVQLAWAAPHAVRFNVGGGITTIPPNIWQDNFLTGSTPYVVYPRLVASPGAQFHYGFKILPSQLPHVYTPQGTDVFANTKPKDVPSNTAMDVDRYEQDLAALLPGHQITPLNLSAISPKFGNGTLYTWTLGLERHFGGLDANAAYVGTAAAKLPAIDYPNGYTGATAEFARYTRFDPNGVIIGGFGTEIVINDRSHSTYHALQTSLSGTIAHGGPGIQASYTWSKSLDDTSSVIPGTGATGAVANGSPQDPFNIRAEKGPSNFDTAHGFTLSVAQDLHGDQVEFLRPVSRMVTGGWELLSISSLSSGSPFTIYSGVQQTGIGAGAADRPDQIGKPHLSTHHASRTDYFGLGENNASYFYIPINVSGGTGPNQGRLGALGRNTFRGPAYHNFDFALIKDTAFGRRSSGAEVVDLQFRSEFFNIFNIVNFGLPANTIRGSGFGEVSRTAGNSRQIQFSLKLIY